MGGNKRRQRPEVELNLAAMLDMAFQLLAFFILTYQSPPIEGQMSLRLPPPQAVTPGGTVTPGTATTTDPHPDPVSLRTLTISVIADPRTGTIASLGLGDAPIASVPALEKRMRELFADPGNPFEQVLVQVSGDCRYDQLMRVIEACARQKLPGSNTLPKLSFVEVPAG